MNHKDSGIVRGTNGSPQIVFDNDISREIEGVNEDVLYEETLLLLELLSDGVKISPEKVVFITRDKTGQIIWLEEGNALVGLKHILDGNGRTPGHTQDFKKALGIERSNVPNYLKNLIKREQFISNKLKKVKGREGYERIYKISENYQVVVAMGTNGFIISAYPKKIERN